MCKYIVHCSFFKEFSNRDSFLWKAMIKSYCDDGENCMRYKTYKIEGEKVLPATLLPSGTHASKALLSLP